MNLEIIKLIRRGTLWMLHNGQRPLDVKRTVHRFARGIDTLAANVTDYLSADLQEELRRDARSYVERGVPESPARRIASLAALFSGCDIVQIAVGGGFPVDAVARVYYAIGARFGLDWLRGAADSLVPESEWQAMAISAIIDDLYAQQSALATKVVDAAGGAAAAEAVVDAWASANGRGIDRVEHLVGELRTAGSVDLAMLAVANREIRSLIAA